MLNGTNFWDTGYMDLYLNNKPTKAYIPPTDPQKVYNLAQTLIANDGKIPIGIDHLPEDTIKKNPILSKLDLLHVGDITAVEFNPDTNTVSILEAELTNPLIRELYDKGELTSVSIVSEVSTTPCPQNNDIPVVNTENLKRVDIVGVGACESCKIPVVNNKTMVYARKPIKEELNMEITEEKLKEMIDEATKPFQEEIDALKEENKALNEKLETKQTPIEPPSNSDESTEVAAMKARLDTLEKEAKANEKKAVLSAANARVDLAIQQGKILPAQKESMVELAASKPEAFDTMIKDAPVIVDIDKKVSLVAGFSLDDDDPEPTAEEKNLESVLNHFKKE